MFFFIVSSSMCAVFVVMECVLGGCALFLVVLRCFLVRCFNWSSVVSTFSTLFQAAQIVY